MSIDKSRISTCLEECQHHLKTELLPFWLDRCKDDVNGGFITHFDRDGNDTGEDEKSLIAQSRTLFTMASAHRAGYGDGRCAEYAKHGADFLIDKMWDPQFGGFYWTVDRQGRAAIDKKILYGLSFAIYSMSEYTLATGDPRGADYAKKAFELIKIHATDICYGGFWEMFERNWDLCGPGAQGGDRKTLDAHMHLMEAFTNLYECTGEGTHRRTLLESIDLLKARILHPEYATGIPQFWADWTIAPQIKFDIIWGWDRFAEGGEKPNAADNTSAGHNVEFAWLLAHATDVLGSDWENNQPIIKKAMDHGRINGIDPEHGGVYVEGPHAGGVHDREKEFWQQAEVMIGMLEGCLRFGMEPYWDAYENVHRFVFDKGIHHPVGEWWPLLSREGEPIWTHMSHSWKVNYHTVRCMIQCIKRLKRLIAEG
jgi:mannose 2-epimerase